MILSVLSSNLNGAMSETNRIQNSEFVGPTLRAALKQIQKEQEQQSQAAQTRRLAKMIRTVDRDPNRLPLRVALKRRKLLARGSGVYEDEHNGDIWYREGEHLIRQKVDVAGVVEDYLATCRGS